MVILYEHWSENKATVIAIRKNRKMQWDKLKR